MLTLLTLLVFAQQQGQRPNPFLQWPDSSFALSLPTLPYSEVRCVANDGANVLAGYDLLHGYRLDRAYELQREYRFRVVFPPETRDAFEKKYKVNKIEASLENDVGLASLRPASSVKAVFAARTWALFPIDRFMDPRPTLLIHLQAKARLLEASLSGHNLSMTVAEDADGTRVAIVDYKFEIAQHDASAVFDAKLVRRVQLQLGFDKAIAQGGEPYESFSLGPGKLSSDRRHVIYGRTVKSLTDKSEKSYRFDPNVENHTEVYFIGNELYSTVRPSVTIPSKSNSPNVGIFKMVDGGWIKVAEAVLDAISANGKYAAVHILPDNPTERAKRYVVKVY